jgi:hypothetical protein
MVPQRAATGKPKQWCVVKWYKCIAIETLFPRLISTFSGRFSNWWDTEFPPAQLERRSMSENNAMNTVRAVSFSANEAERERERHLEIRQMPPSH